MLILMLMLKLIITRVMAVLGNGKGDSVVSS